MTSFCFSEMTVVSPEGLLKNTCVEVSQGLISKIQSKPIPSQKRYEFPNHYLLIPGMIDLHIHGANNYDVMDASPEALKGIQFALAKEGVTGFLATTMTASTHQIDQVLKTVYEGMQEAIKGAAILGVHLEGPYLSPHRVGAQSRDHLLSLKTESIVRWQQLSKGIIKIVTLAPELTNSSSFIECLRQLKIIASIGHSDATYQECMSAINAGCSHVTHLFNAMRGMHQREPGVVGAALLSNQVNAELIVDGVHVCPEMINLALKLKNKDRLVLVTDAMRAKCMKDGLFELGGKSVHVKNQEARLSDGTLAGSTLAMNHALKNMMDYTGCSLLDAVTMAAYNPARILNLHHQQGSIEVGKQADLVVLDEAFNVVMTVVAGEIVFNTSVTSLTA